MKKVLSIFLFIYALNVAAQSPADSLFILQKQISQQKQEFRDSLNSLETLMGTQNEKLKILNQSVFEINRQLKHQGSEITVQKQKIDGLFIENNHLKKSIDSLKELANTNSSNIKSIAANLDTKIQETKATAHNGLVKLDKNIGKNKLYWIIATLIIFLLGGLIYWLLDKRISSSKTDIEVQIDQTKRSLEEESIRLDNKLIEVLETQLKISQAEREVLKEKLSNEIDHSLALKVASEIVRMQKNISRMTDKGTKGLKPLKKGIERIQANFAANGYEMINLLNTEYDERMNIDVINFIDDDKIERGKKIITKIIKPQVNYKGVLIQRGQVDVTQN